jgi:hypothetical protein
MTTITRQQSPRFPQPYSPGVVAEVITREVFAFHMFDKTP